MMNPMVQLMSSSLAFSRWHSIWTAALMPVIARMAESRGRTLRRKVVPKRNTKVK